RPSTRISPPADELQRAAAVLDEGSKVAMLVGAGARGATEEVLAVADRLGAGIVTSLLGKDVVPGDVPHHTQQRGDDPGTEPVRDRSEEHTSELQSRFDLVCRLLL